MPDAFGVTPARMEDILDLSLIGATSEVDTGVIIQTRSGTKQLTGPMAKKSIVRLSAFDIPSTDSTLPEWLTPFSAPALLSDSGGLTTSGQKVSWSADGRYIAITKNTFSLYKRFGNSFTVVSIASPPASARGGEWSLDSQYFAIALGSSPYLNLYKRAGDVLTKLADPPALTNQGLDVAWSDDGVYLLVSQSSSPYAVFYSRSGDTLTKLSAPDVLPAGSPSGVSWAKGSVYSAIAHATSPYVTVYKRNGSSFAKLANPITLPTGTANQVRWSPDGQYLAVAHANSPFVTVYKRSGDTLVKLDNPSSLPSSAVLDLAWSPDGRHLVCTHSAAPYTTTYKLVNDLLVPQSTLTSGGIVNAGGGVGFSPDGRLLVVQLAATPYSIVYSAAESIYGGVPDLIND